MSSRVSYWWKGLLIVALTVLLLSPGEGFTGSPAKVETAPDVILYASPSHVKPGASFTASYLDTGGKITRCLLLFDGQSKSCLGRNNVQFTAYNKGTHYLNINVDGPGGGIVKCTIVKVSDEAVPEPPSPVYGTWTSIYAPLFRTPSDLEVLRQYRDEFLTRTGRGKLYTDLLYENSEAALQVLMNNPELIERARILLQANQDGILQVLDGKEALVTQPDDIAAFLDDFAARSPATLKVLAKMVKREMLQKFREDKPFIGFRRE